MPTGKRVELCMHMNVEEQRKLLEATPLVVGNAANPQGEDNTRHYCDVTGLSGGKLDPRVLDKPGMPCVDVKTEEPVGHSGESQTIPVVTEQAQDPTIEGFEM